MKQLAVCFTVTLLAVILSYTSAHAQRGNVVIQDETGQYYDPEQFACDPTYDPSCVAEDEYYEPEPAPFGTVNNKFLEVTEERADILYATIKKVSYVLAGIGAIALVVMAAFGKFQWKWFFMLIGGLFLLAGFQAMVNFLN